MKKYLEEFSKEEILGFLDDYSKSDSRLANAIKVHFCDPGYDEELDKMKKAIDVALEGVYDYSTRDSWGNVNFCTGDIISEIRTRLKQGHIRLAFAETVMLYRELLNLFEYQGECEISMEAEYCIEIMSDIADAANSNEEKEHIFGQCIMLSEIKDGKDYGADYEDELLGIAAKLVTLDNRAELEDALNRVEVNRLEESIVLIQLGIIQKFDGAEATQEFINENLRFQKIREMAYETAMLHEDFTEGERLCVEAIATEARSYGISPWMYRLFTVYEKAASVDEMVEAARKIVFLGNMEYYDKLKSLLIECGTWDNGYRDFLRECEARMHYMYYMKVLAKEREYTLLLGQLKKHTREIYVYGELLAKEYPADVLGIYINQINREAKTATKRSMYKSVCENIASFAKMGYHSDAIDLILGFQMAYRHRPAFIDELNLLNAYLVPI